MGLRCTNYFENSKYDSPNIQIITCQGCSSHLCLSDLIISDQFNGSSGPAYLVENIINFEFDSQFEEQEMRTGMYLISKIRCHQCKKILGWYYKKSFSYRETYKEGKFVIEKAHIKFIDNNSLTPILIENALRNKFRRRYSSTSTVSSDELELHSHSSAERRQRLPSSTLETLSKYDTFKFHTSNEIKRKIDYRDVHNGLFLNRLSLPTIENKDESSSSTVVPLRRRTNENDDDDDVFVDA